MHKNIKKVLRKKIMKLQKEKDKEMQMYVNTAVSIVL